MKKFIEWLINFIKELLSGLVASTVEANTNIEQTPYENLFKKYASKYNLDWRVLSAIAFVESSYLPNAVNYADNESIGLMQVLCKPDGKGGCIDIDERTKWLEGWIGIKRNDLLVAEKNISVGAQILAHEASKYGLLKGIARYNSLSAQTAPPKGPFPNQSYVDKVVKRARELGYEIR